MSYRNSYKLQKELTVFHELLKDLEGKIRMLRLLSTKGGSTRLFCLFFEVYHNNWTKYCLTD